MELSQMTVEEFMKANWDSDDSNDSAKPKNENTKLEQPKLENDSKESEQGTKKRKKKRKQSKKLRESTNAGKVEKEGACKPEPDGKTESSHQNSLNRLREKDPEFYEFLQQEDDSLLHFDDKEFDIDETSDDDDDDDGQGYVHKLPDKLEEASDSDLEYGSDVSLSDEEGDSEIQQREKEKEKERIPVTDKMIEEWKTKLMGPKSSLPALKNVMLAFHCAIARFNDDGDTKKKKEKHALKFKVENSGTFNAVVGICIRHVVPSLAKLLDYRPDKTSRKIILPSRSKPWVKVRGFVQSYLSDVVALNQLLLEPSVVGAALRHTILLIPYFLSFPKNTKLLLKFLIKSWSSAEDESVRVLTFLCINRIVKLDKQKYLEPALRQCYLSYVANCKFTTPSILPMINFMQQTLSELFAISPTVTYQLSFLYIRQLAIHLRKAMTVPKRENYQAVYNWQYVHCLGLWCRVVGNLYSNDVIKPLLYPLVQVSLGSIDLVPTARYFPLRYHIIRYLTMLSDATNAYIPLLPYITRPLKLAEFSKKKGGAISEPLKFTTILKMSNSQLKEASYRSSTMDEIYHALMEYINTQAHTISFPEMMVPSIVLLKKYAKNCKMPNYVKLVRQIIDKVEENSKFILEKRSEVTFGVADANATEKWEMALKNTGVPFHKHSQRYKDLHQKESQHALANKGRIVEERLPTVDRKKFMELSKNRDRKEFGELFGNDDEVGDIQIDLEKLIEEGKASRKRKISTEVEEENELSDADSEHSHGSLEDSQIENVEQQSSDDKKQPEATTKEITVGAKRSKVIDDDGDDEPDVVEDFCFSSDED